MTSCCKRPDIEGSSKIPCMTRVLVCLSSETLRDGNQLHNCQIKAHAFDNVKDLEMSQVQEREGIVSRNSNSLAFASVFQHTNTN